MLTRTKRQRRRRDWSGFKWAPGESGPDRRKRKRKREKEVKSAIRGEVFDRDPSCVVPDDPRWRHDGPDEWAHMEGGTRARTRGRPPEERHTTRLSCRLCRTHHFAYDRGRLRPTFLTERGANGPMEWRFDGELVGGGR